MEQTTASLNVPQEALNLFDESYAFEENGEHKDALRLCEQAIELAPDWAEAHNLRGMALEGLGRQAAAVAAYRRAVELAPDDPELRENLLGAEQELEEAALPELPASSLPDYYTPLAPGEDLVTVATFSYPIEAYLAKTKLDWEEIPCFVADDRLIAANWLYSRAIGGVRLRVKSSDIEAALEVLETPPLDEAELEAQAGPDDPRCPDCNSLDVHCVPASPSQFSRTIGNAALVAASGTSPTWSTSRRSMPMFKNWSASVYMLNLTLLITHEIDSAYWQEWDLFGLPGGIQLFLVLNLLLVGVGLWGLRQVLLDGKGRRAFSLVLAGAGLFAAAIHTYFILAGRSEFTLPVSLGLLAAILVVSLVQVLLVLEEGRWSKQHP
jgi:tetratricopeptide (TPR) repeat protein